MYAPAKRRPRSPKAAGMAIVIVTTPNIELPITPRITRSLGS